MSEEYPVSLVSIYALIDPRTSQVRYVGKSVLPAKRLQSHLRECPLARNHRECWLKGLVDAGLKPEIVILEQCEDAAWIEREQWWIARYRSLGADLTNRTIGGDGLRNPSQETRDKIAAGVSKAHKGRKQTAEHIVARTAPLKGRKPSDACLDGVRRANSERIWSDASREKLSAAHMGRKMSAESQAKRFEKRAQIFTLISPCGERIAIKGFARFCRENGLERTAFLNAIRKGRPYKGWLRLNTEE